YCFFFFFFFQAEDGIRDRTVTGVQTCALPIPLVLPAGAATQPYAQVNGIACHSAGNCVAVGDYQYGRSRDLQAFIATESHGRWRSEERRVGKERRYRGEA